MESKDSLQILYTQLSKNGLWFMLIPSINNLFFWSDTPGLCNFKVLIYSHSKSDCFLLIFADIYFINYQQKNHIFILSLFPPLEDCGMKFYKEQYTKNIPHTHKQEKKNYITLLPLGIEEKKMTKKTKTETYIHGDVHLSMTWCKLQL